MGNMWRMAQLTRAAINAEAGRVRIHAETICFTTLHRIPLMLWEEPTPMMAEEMTWVVETGAPRAVATKMTAAPEVSAANPCTG